jgi:hypothetical protein
VVEDQCHRCAGRPPPGRASGVPKTRPVNLIGDPHFKPSESGLTFDSTQACLKGKYLTPDGNTYTFLGCDSVLVVN